MTLTIEIVKEFFKNKNVQKCLKELAKAEKLAVKLLKVDNEVGNRIFKKYSFINKRTKEPITDYNNLYQSDNEEEHLKFYHDCDLEFQKLGYDYLSEGCWPGLTADAERIRLENELLNYGEALLDIPTSKIYDLKLRKQALTLLKNVK